jgi:hypothetical protein
MAIGRSLATHLPTEVEQPNDEGPDLRQRGNV